MTPIQTPLVVSAVWIALLTAIHSAAAQTWTQTSAQSKLWNSVACSADGSKVVAVGEFGQIHVSTNSGLIWVANTIPNNNCNWSAVTASADGSHMVVVAGTGQLYLSTNSGGTWTSNSVPEAMQVSHGWKSVACSADGNKVVAVANVGIAVSTNCGETWLQTNIPNQPCVSVACSAAGNNMVVAADIGGIYTSTNLGTVWISNNISSKVWESVACSADGEKLTAVEWQGRVYTATHSSATWTSTVAPNGLLWNSAACSADGSKIVVAAGDNGLTGPIYVSTNSGATWSLSSAGNYHWTSVASSSDGHKMYATRYGGGIFTLQSTVTPQLNLAPSPTNFTLAWTVPSTNFVLQQSADLLAWADVTNPPVLNLTNLQNQVTLPPSGTSAFFRLKTP
jgi:hypothetical protein